MLRLKFDASGMKVCQTANTAATSALSECASVSPCIYHMVLGSITSRKGQVAKP